MPASAEGNRHFPTRELLERAEFTDDAGIIRFVDTDAAARLLNLMPHTLESYRSLGGGPEFYKFGRWVRYEAEKACSDEGERLVRLVPPAAAARYLGLTTHTLKLRRRMETGPRYYKFGNWVRYALGDLDTWAASCKRRSRQNTDKRASQD